MPTLWNDSTKVSDEDCVSIMRAVDEQLRRDFDPEFDMTPWTWGFEDQDRYINFHIVDYDTDVEGALAYHNSNDGRPVAVTMAGTILDNGGSILDGPNSVSSATSHEALETKLDPRAQLGAMNWTDGHSYWYEASDACQAFAYEIGGVSVSDFCTKSWFDAGDPTGPFDHLGKLTAPFQIGPGGYQVRYKPGEEATVHALEDGRQVRTFGEVVGTPPPWHGWRTMKRLRWEEVA